MAKLRIYKPAEDENVLEFHCLGCKTRHVLSKALHSYNNNPNSPTFAPSVLVTGSVRDDDGVRKLIRCHSFITDGKIQYLDDCSHDLKNQTLELPEIPEEC